MKHFLFFLTFCIPFMMCSQSKGTENNSMLAKTTCGNLFASMGEGGVDTGKNFEGYILEQLGLPMNVKNKEAIVADFLNKHAKELICYTGSDADSIRNGEQILKKAIGVQFMGIFSYMDENGKYKGKINFNNYEIIDGEKETLLDYVYKIYDDNELLEEYDEDKISELIRIIKSFGGKRGKDLKE